jgi:hypothetical protein
MRKVEIIGDLYRGMPLAHSMLTKYWNKRCLSHKGAPFPWKAWELSDAIEVAETGILLDPSPRDFDPSWGHPAAGERASPALSPVGFWGKGGMASKRPGNPGLNTFCTDSPKGNQTPVNAVRGTGFHFLL